MKTKEAKMEFLEDKLRLLGPFMAPEFTDFMRQLYAQLHFRLAQLPAGSLLSADRELEQRIAIILTPEQATALRGELVKRFGCSCIGRNPASIMQAILAKGKISNDQEVELVRDRLADQIRPSFGSDEYLTFSRIMAEYETRHK